MKSKKMKLLIIASAVLSLHAIAADNFSGFYIGGKGGYNQLELSGNHYKDNTTESLTAGAEVGYNYVFKNNFVLGADLFYDYVDRKANSNVDAGNFGTDGWGADVKLGYQIAQWMPYAKLGYGRIKGTDVIRDFSANAFHGGLGVEYKIAPAWGLTGEWLATSPSDNGVKIKSNSVTLGLNYHFGAKAAPAPVAVTPMPTPHAEPVVVVAPEPVKAQVVAPKPPMETRHFSLKSDVLFDSGKATITQQGRDELNKLYEQVANIDARDGRAIVVGYTDRTGPAKLNKDLSYRRAQAVSAYLISRGAPANRIEVQGMGSANPVTGASCNGIGNRARYVTCLAPDRRVEVDIQGTQTTVAQ
ncbi:OOP family OmpA-OmpF porin [Silvimonas terrae]|uniref:OOP family OmpA-OmpF porin n=1 Tax=Silvimonas terrae TaxID=300266 RepID=A0A840RBU0_9NEIS|nr:outer membrane beta-barrel protein [Silvimonas terrae]MBB5190397.1 OOP family OmpA-OmpF porin [Silvimonas terrae]